MKERHYFTDNSDLPSHRKEVACSVGKRTWTFVTDDGVFSKNEVDRGTVVLLKALMYEKLRGKILDLGCGYGVIAVVLKSSFPETEMTASEINPRALQLAEENAKRNSAEVKFLESDGFASVEGTFDVIVTNPPIRAGKAVIYGLFARAADFLAPKGALYVVIRKQQGAPSALKYLQERYPRAEIVGRGSGYHVIRASMDAVSREM